MNTIWHYYDKNGEKQGPISGGQLKGLAKAGLITPETIIETETGKTALARKVKGLVFAEAVQTAPTSVLSTPPDVGNPFTATLSAVTNPPTVHAPTINKTANQTALPQTALPRVLVPVAENNEKSSWQITIVGVALILVVGGLGWAVITSFSPSAQLAISSSIEQEAIVLSKEPLAMEDVIEQVEYSVARIEGPGGSGSGFLVRPQILATNYHVIERLFLEQVEVFFPSATGKEKGPFGARLLYADADRDIAFLRVESTLPALSLASNHQFRRGQEIIAIGSPGELENAVNLGVLSSEREIDGQKYYQLGMSINPGNSGGPILDREGNVIGIATLKSAVQEGIAYCIPVANVLEALTTTEKLTASQRDQNNSQHRARVALNLLSLVTVLYLDCMDEYDTYMEVAIMNGRPANEGIQVAAKKIEERMEIVEFVFLDKVEKEFDKIKQDSNLSWEFRRKLTEFHINCMEIKSYVDRPRGTPASYRNKMNELTETGIRLARELRSLLGLPAK